MDVEKWKRENGSEKMGVRKWKQKAKKMRAKICVKYEKYGKIHTEIMQNMVNKEYVNNVIGTEC